MTYSAYKTTAEMVAAKNSSSQQGSDLYSCEDYEHLYNLPNICIMQDKY